MIRIKAQEPLRISSTGGGVTSVRALIGIGPTGLPGPGSAAWTAAQAVTTGSVRQAPDGSWIKSTGNRTTGATFDATEQTYWETVSVTAGTLEQVALTAAYVAEGSQTWDVRKHGFDTSGVALCDTAWDDLFALANPGDTIKFPNGATVKFGSRHDIDKKIVIDAGDATFVQASTTGIFRVVAGGDGSRFKNMYGVGPSGATLAANSKFIAVEGTAGGTWVEDIHVENVTGEAWGYGTLECRYASGLVTSNVLSLSNHHVGQSFLSCEDIVLHNPMTDGLTGLVGGPTAGQSYPWIFSRDSTLPIATAPRTKDAKVYGGWARNTTWEAGDGHGAKNVFVYGYTFFNTLLGVYFTRCPDEFGVEQYAALNCWGFGIVGESNVSDGSAREAFGLVGASGGERATGGFVGCTGIGYGDQSNSGSGTFYFRDTTGARLIGGTAIEGAPHALVAYANNTDLHVDGLDMVDPWSNSVAASSAIYLSGTGQSLSLAGVKLRVGTKAATYLNVAGIRATAGDVTSQITWGSGNDLSAAAAMYAGGGSATMLRESHYGQAPRAQESSTTDIKNVLVNQGLLIDGGATSLNLDGGSITASGGATLGTTNITGNTDVTGNVTSHGTNGVSSDIVDPTSARSFNWKTNGSLRWAMQASGAESGSDAGSDWQMISRTDAGSAKHTIASIVRSLGVWKAGRGTAEARVSQTLAANGAVTIDAATGSVQSVTLQANASSSSITNPTTGQRLTITWLQDATGSRAYAWPTTCKFAGGAAPVASILAGARDRVMFEYDGTNWLEISRAVGVV